MILMSTDNPDAPAIARAAAEKVACELDWGDNCNATVELWQVNMAEFEKCEFWREDIAAWVMEPGEDAEPGHLCPVCGFDTGEYWENCGASEDGTCPECGYTFPDDAKEADSE